MKRLLWLIVLALTVTGSSALAQTPSLQHHGFNVNFAEINESPRKDVVLASVKEQIDIVEKVGLGKEDLNFFRSIPLVVLLDSSGSPGIYGARKKTVFLKGKEIGPDKPILLHELLHAYHHQRMPQGYRNEQINQFYLSAKEAFPEFQGQYFLSNKREFFAVTASIYLFGKIARPPYNRQNLKEKQPVYYKYLATLFGEKNPSPVKTEVKLLDATAPTALRFGRTRRFHRPAL